jgi:methylglutaconyl-CoA hydratase
MDSLVFVHNEGSGIHRVVLNRPERRNALSIELLDELCAAFESLAAVTTNRVVILTGAGPVFSSGLDLKQAADDSLVEQSAACVEKSLHLMRQLPLIVVAAVRGGAFAGGAGLMAACDVVIAADTATIGFPEARRGLLPALISDVLKSRVREGDLRDLFLTGDAVSAERAREMGLVQRVVPASELMDKALQTAKSIIAGGPETIRQTKLLLNESFPRPPHQADSAMSKLHLLARHSHEAKDGLAAFVEKRNPFWLP